MNSNLVAGLQSLAFLRKHIAEMFRKGGGVRGFQVWATDVFQLLQPDVQSEPEPAPQVEDDDDGEAILHTQVRAPEPPLSVVGRETPQPRPAPPPDIDVTAIEVRFAQAVDARLAQFQAALPATVEAIVRQVMPRPSLPLPLNLPPVPAPAQQPTVGPYDRNARPAFAPNLGWPQNTR